MKVKITFTLNEFAHVHKILFLALFLLGYGLAAQKNSLEFGLGSVNDREFNVNTNPMNHVSSVPVISNRYSLTGTILYERPITNVASIIVGSGIVTRKFNYLRHKTIIGDFFHNTIHALAGLRLNRQLNDQYRLRLDLCPGLNYVTTKNINSVNVAAVNETNEFRFVRADKPAPFFSVCLSLESRISARSALVVFLNGNYQLAPLFRFYARDKWFEARSSEVYPHFISGGLAFRILFAETSAEKAN